MAKKKIPKRKPLMSNKMTKEDRRKGLDRGIAFYESQIRKLKEIRDAI